MASALLFHRQLSTGLVVLLLLLLLHSVQPFPPGSPRTHPHRGPQPGHSQDHSSHIFRYNVDGGGLPARTRGREKRQAFDFGSNAAPPRPNTSDSGEDSGSGEGLPPSGGTGQDLGSFLGGLFGSSAPTDSSETGEGGGGSSGNTGGGLGDVFGGSENSSSVASTTGHDTATQTSPTSPPTTTCTGINMCHFGNPCEQGKACFYNTTSCVVSCVCPPPYDDPQLYDQVLCRPLGTTTTTTPPFSPSTTTTSTVTPGVTCSGLNTCHLGHRCEHGGRCEFNTSTCRVFCVCPPPYDDPRLYDQSSCSPLPTTPDPTATTNSSSSSAPFVTSSTQPSQLPTTTLRPIGERRCRDVTCIHGYCNSTDLTRDPCRCDPGWRGFFCTVGCFRVCANGGRCVMDLTTSRETCNCQKPWRGDNCTELPPDPAPEQDEALVSWLSGSFSVGLVLTVILAALFMFFLWRKRLVFALKVVYYFLPYEDNDGRRYDAFVSYVLEDADESFVHTDLRPKLENDMGFSLCLHQRDFTLGEVISDSILDALENSRRFILILTPSYLRNEWAEFEFQRAFHEMLKRRIRIIPIILEDLNVCPDQPLNTTLQTILDSVTPIQYPGPAADERKLHKFWKRVKLCMPKKKRKDEVNMVEAPRENHDAAATGVPADDALEANNNKLFPNNAAAQQFGGDGELAVGRNVPRLYPHVTVGDCGEAGDTAASPPPDECDVAVGLSHVGIGVD
ncbi:uncharacterized protein LOC143280450 [Babylonia areolata]|uniref:uncharacterized protein LOC143280450 n=1 Tax=Babylonia areolata TaxID=304850 RepID=UPI003FD65187